MRILTVLLFSFLMGEAFANSSVGNSSCRLVNRGYGQICTLCPDGSLHDCKYSDGSDLNAQRFGTAGVTNSTIDCTTPENSGCRIFPRYGITIEANKFGEYYGTNSCWVGTEPGVNGRVETLNSSDPNLVILGLFTSTFYGRLIINKTTMAGKFLGNDHSDNLNCRKIGQ